MQKSLRDATDEVASTRSKIMVVSAIAALLMLIAFGVANRSARSREERLESLDRTLHEEAERNELEARLQRALEMAPTEASAVALVGRALASSAPGVPAELLVADSSRAHFRQVATSDGDGPGCGVMAPSDCPGRDVGTDPGLEQQRGARRVPVPPGPPDR